MMKQLSVLEKPTKDWPAFQPKSAKAVPTKNQEMKHCQNFGHYSIEVPSVDN